MSRNNESSKTNFEVRLAKSMQAYLEIMSQTAHGTPGEGIAEQDLAQIFCDRRTLLVPYGDGLAWPIVTPIENHTEHFLRYFQEGKDERKYFYLALPNTELLKGNPGFTKSIVEVIKYALHNGQSVVFEESADHDVTDFLERHGLNQNTFSIDSFMDSESDVEEPASTFKVAQQRDEMLSGSNRRNPTEQAADIIERHYSEIVSKFTLGPQIEGIDPESLSAALANERTHFIQLIDESGNQIKVPFLVPLQYAPWLNPEFIRKSGIDTDTTYFSALPQAFLIQNSKAIDSVIKNGISYDKNINVLIDYPEFVKPFYEDTTLDHQVNDLLTSNGTPAATYHYMIKVDASHNNELEALTLDPRIRKIKQDEIDIHFERIWEIYSQQFQALVDDHPINGALPKNDLRNALLSPSSSTYAYIDEKGTVQSVGYFERDLEMCPWLSKDFFDVIADNPTVYMPGVVSARGLPFPVSHKIMQAVLYSNTQEYRTWNMTFECSNLSATYIPKLILRLIEHEKIAKYGKLREIKHLYKVIQFSP